MLTQTRGSARPTAAHTTITLSDRSSLTFDELRNYRGLCTGFIAMHGRSGWAYTREFALLFAITRQLREIGDIELDEE